jgi:hypothetical protein
MSSKLVRAEGDDAAESYRELIADFLAAVSFKQAHGGYPAFEGELIADKNVVEIRRTRTVHISSVRCQWPGHKVAPRSYLWFVIDNQARFSSFAVESELVIEALENVDHSSPLGRSSHLPATEANDPGDKLVIAGGPLYVRINPVRVEPPLGNLEPRLPPPGIRFEVGEADESGEVKGPPAYSFAMAGLTPLAALAAALWESPDLEERSFAEELDEFTRELEEATLDDDWRSRASRALRRLLPPWGQPRRKKG